PPCPAVQRLDKRSGGQNPHGEAAMAATGRRRIWRGLAAAAAALVLAGATEAKTFRWANDGDANSMDPYARQETFLLLMDMSFYEPLLRRSREMKLEPGLATEWARVEPTVWRFKLRSGVKFHDGAPFTADDVVFSIERALHKNSQRSFQLRGILEARKVDDLTVDFLLAAPDAVLPEKLIYIGMMSKAWSMTHGVVEPQNYNAKQETYAVRNTNGTGPYKLKSYESDVRTVLVANPDWWGRRGNVDEAIYVVIQSDATRLAALVSGQVDFVIDPPFQDVARLKQEKRFKLAEMTDIGTQYLGFDQSREELQFGDVKGRNPFKD